MEPEHSAPRIKLLVIGYGNTLRGDDGVGPRVAEAVDALHLPDVRAISCGLLTPELAEPLSKTRCVIFVDASAETQGKTALQELAPADSSQIFAHAADPRTLLALSRDVFGHTPRAWWLTIPTENLGIGEHLSGKAQKGMADAIEKIQQMYRLA
jgi:hydrogenase maturation protease